MRKAAIDELTRIARADRRVVLLTADLGFGVLDDFAKELPDQFVNVGVAEQAMVGIATGMAEAGFIPYCYSIATFSFLRPFEFIRNGPVAHHLPVRIIGVGAGTDYSFDGLTHYAVEDLAIARSQPGLSVFSPVTDDDTKALLREAHELTGPAYLRLSRQAAPTATPDVRATVPEKTDVLLLSLGTSGDRARTIAAGISEAGLSTRVLSVLRFDERTADDLAAHLAGARSCLTVEDHYASGGLGTAAAEVIATRALGLPLTIDAITSLPVGTVGSLPYMESKLRRSVSDIVGQAVSSVKASGDAP